MQNNNNLINKIKFYFPNLENKHIAQILLIWFDLCEKNNNSFETKEELLKIAKIDPLHDLTHFTF